MPVEFLTDSSRMTSSAAGWPTRPTSTRSPPPLEAMRGLLTSPWNEQNLLPGALVALAVLVAGAAAAHLDGLPLRPKPVRIRRPGEPLAAEEIDLRERLQAQPHPNAELR
ncbi:hypothetical protein [Streptomyces prasinus]|uniref:hypothetical protein n=1 Tax=Streptomyces prasinus TaxID=67345 RepID=UPI003628AE74